MNQLVIDKAPSGVDHVSTSWEIASDPLFENIIQSTPQSTEELEVYTVRNIVLDDDVFYGRARRHYRNPDNSISIENWLPYDVIVRNQHGRYDNLLTSDPVKAPSIVLTETDNELIIDTTAMETEHNLSEHESTSYIIINDSGKTKYANVNDTINLRNITIEKSTLDPSMLNGALKILVAHSNNLNETSRFSETTRIPSDDRISLLSDVSNIYSSRSTEVTFKVNSSDPLRLCDSVSIKDKDGNVAITFPIEPPISLTDTATITIPSFTLTSNKEYLMYFSLTDSVDDAIKILKTSNNDLVYISDNSAVYGHNLTDIIDTIPVPETTVFSVELLSNSTLISIDRDLIGPDLTEQEKIDIVDSLDTLSDNLELAIINFDIGGDINAEALTVSNYIDDLITIVTNISKKIEKPTDTFNKFKKLNEDLMRKLYIMDKSTEEETTLFRDMSNKASSILTQLDILQHKTFALNVVRFIDGVSDVSSIDFFKISEEYFNVIEINYNTVLIDTISVDGVRQFTLIKIDTIGFTNQVIYTVDVSLDNNDNIGKNAITYVNGTEYVYFNKAVLVNGVLTTKLMSFNYKSKVITELTSRPGKPDGSDFVYLNSALEAIGNGKLISLGGTYTGVEPYTYNAAFIYDTVTGVWDNISSIDLNFTNSELFSIKLLNGNILFINSDELSSGLIYDVGENSFTVKTYDNNPVTEINGILIPHKDNPYIICNDRVLKYKYN